MHYSGAINALTAQVNELAQVCARLSRENVELRNQVAALSLRRPPVAASTSLQTAAEPGGLKELAERGINRRTVGVALVGAAAGVVGAAVLTDRGARPVAISAETPVAAEENARVELATADEPATAAPTGNGVIVPAIVTLSDAAKITVNARLGNDFRVTVGGHRTFANPTGSVDGQRITFTIRQGSGAPHKVTWSNQYNFGAAGAPVLSTTAGSTDVIGFIYNRSLGSWLCAGVARGF